MLNVIKNKQISDFKLSEWEREFDMANPNPSDASDLDEEKVRDLKNNNYIDGIK